MSNPYSFKSGDHLVICQSCGAQRYRSECSYTWDGYLMCHVRGCWHPKEPVFAILPVINDPAPIYDVSPDQVSGDETYIDNTVGMWTTIGNTNVYIGHTNKKLGQYDDPPSYI